MRVRTLETALSSRILAGKRNLSLLLLQLILDLPVGNIAHLMVLIDDQPVLITHAALTIWHHSIASIVTLTDVAMNSTPPVLAIAIFAIAQGSIFAIGKGTADRSGAVISAKSRRTYTVARETVAVREMLALELVKLAVEARRTFRRSVVV